MLILLFFALCLSSTLPTVSTEGVVVKSALGFVEGFTHENTDGSTSEIFLGIRYAKPPTGKLRFEKPMPHNDWEGVLETKNFSKGCVPIHETYLSKDQFDEDCLFLNIIRPSGKPKHKDGFPVLVFIHGGGFMSGSAAQYGYKSLSEHFASHGIMVVTFQYRLGPFGYFSTGDKVLAGNYGFWDQMYALFFMNQFLPNFHGNVFQVTVMGHSAGAAAVHGLGISPYSVELFHRGIQLSGSLFCEWAMHDKVVKNSLNLADAVDCSSKKESIAIHDCMKKKSVEEILKGVEKLGVHEPNIRQFLFTPRLDGEFFPQTTEMLMKGAPDVPVIFGLGDAESSEIVNDKCDPIRNNMCISKERQAKFDARELQIYIADHVVSPDETGRSGGGLRNSLYEFYVDKGAPKDANASFYLQRAVDIVGDLSNIVPVIQQIEIRNGYDQNSYLFYQKYSHQKQNNKIHGAAHGNELDYIFDLDLPRDYEFTENDKIFQQNLLDMIRTFTKDGEPKTSGVKWPKTRKSLNHVVLDPSPSIEDKFLKDRMKFWLHDLPKTVGTKILQETRLPHVELHQKHTEL